MDQELKDLAEEWLEEAEISPLLELGRRYQATERERAEITKELSTLLYNDAYLMDEDIDEELKPVRMSGIMGDDDSETLLCFAIYSRMVDTLRFKADEISSLRNTIGGLIPELKEDTP